MPVDLSASLGYPAWQDDWIRFVLPTGRMMKTGLEHLRRAGYSWEEGGSSRRLLFHNDVQGAMLLLAKPSDVLTYVSRGVADLGIIGKDMLLESQAEVVELADLEFAQCRLVLAAPAGSTKVRAGMRVATKYPNLAQGYFSRLNLPVELILLQGSVELAPLVGLADMIIDLVDSGQTLKENDLVVLDTVVKSSTRLVANSSSYHVKPQLLSTVAERVEAITIRGENNAHS